MIAFETVAFYIFAAALLAFALAVALARNPVHAAIFLAASFLSMAGIWMLLLAEFLALALVLVYVGAVMVLFLFVLMMLDANLETLRKGFWRGMPLALAVMALLGVEMTATLNVFSESDAARFSAPDPDPENTRALGRTIYTDYAYPFQLAAVILLAAMVAAIALTLRRRAGLKRLDPGAQAAVSPVGRVRLAKMESSRPADWDDDSHNGSTSDSPTHPTPHLPPNNPLSGSNASGSVASGSDSGGDSSRSNATGSDSGGDSSRSDATGSGSDSSNNASGGKSGGGSR